MSETEGDSIVGGVAFEFGGGTVFSDNGHGAGGED